MDHALADFTLISLVAETIYRTVAAAAIVVGGGWAYLKYVRGRTFTERLSLSVGGDLQRAEDPDLLRLVIECGASNVGSRKVTIGPDASGVLLKALSLQDGAPQTQGKPRRAVWEELVGYPVFDDYSVIEPGETLEDTIVAELPGAGLRTLRLQLEVYSARGERAWRTSKVVHGPPVRDNTVTSGPGGEQ